MKARKRNSNDDWQEVEYVQLKDSYVITKADQMEFENETTGGTKYLPNYAYDHWKDVRERAAIAAMQGLLANPQLFYDNGEEKIIIEAKAMSKADELIRRLKKE